MNEIAMEDRYKIKEEFKKYVVESIRGREFVKCADGEYYCAFKYLHLTDECFYKIEKRIELFIQDSISNRSAYLVKKNQNEIFARERELCESN